MNYVTGGNPTATATPTPIPAQNVIVSRPGDFNGDGKDDVVCFTQGAGCDVWVALSTGGSFGTSTQWHDYFSASGNIPLVGDFNGDGKDDVVSFTRDSSADVWVALSSGSSFGTPGLWHDTFCGTGSIPAVGDFNGDGKDDVIGFQRNGNNDVWVALSNGSSFGTPSLWHDDFCGTGHVPAVGDFNGDGKDDVVSFQGGGDCDVWVALSNGSSFTGPSLWHDYFRNDTSTPVVGDFNGDGKDDVAAFTLGSTCDVWVALSSGSGFGNPTVWHDYFGGSGSVPGAGDFNGDGKDDVVVFTRDSNADVWVLLSNGTEFGGVGCWHAYFCADGSTPGAGDFNGDGKDDVVCFTHGTGADVWVALSNGTRFTGPALWHDYFCGDGSTPLTGDFNGDGKDDVVCFTHGTGADVWVALSSGSGFGTSTQWHDTFCGDGHTPVVGDFNGDGKDDVASFTHGADCDVWVALSNGSSFGTPSAWHGYFCGDGSTPLAGDFNNDGKDDVVCFTHGTGADVWVALSNGGSFTGPSLWHDYFCGDGHTPRVGDFNGDGKDDVASFTHGGGCDVWVALSGGSSFSGPTHWHDYFCATGNIPEAGDFSGDGKDDAASFTLGTGCDVFVVLSQSSFFEYADVPHVWHDYFCGSGSIPQPGCLIW